MDSSFSSSAMMQPVDSAADVHDPTADPAVDPDDISECSDLEAQLNLSTQLQMASILSFAYIWSLGAFIPFRYMLPESLLPVIILPGKHPCIIYSILHGSVATTIHNVWSFLKLLSCLSAHVGPYPAT